MHAQRAPPFIVIGNGHAGSELGLVSKISRPSFHDFHPATRAAAVEWFKKWLGQ